MKTMTKKEIENLTSAISEIANAITPSRAHGTNDASGGFVSSHTEAIMGVTASLQSIAGSISELAEAVRQSSSQVAIADSNISPELALFTRHEAASYIRVSIRTLDELTARGKVSTIKIGKKMLIKKTSLDEFISSCEIKALS